VKKGQNAGFRRLISSKITPAKEKERRKRKNEGEERRRKKAKVPLLVFIIATV